FGVDAAVDELDQLLVVADHPEGCVLGAGRLFRRLDESAEQGLQLGRADHRGRRFRESFEPVDRYPGAHDTKRVTAWPRRRYPGSTNGNQSAPGRRPRGRAPRL